MNLANAELWLRKWGWYERNSLPWNRLALHREFAGRKAFVRWPLHGDALQAFRDGRLEIGEHAVMEPARLARPHRRRRGSRSAPARR